MIAPPTRAIAFAPQSRWPIVYVVARWSGCGWIGAAFADPLALPDSLLYQSWSQHSTEVEAERATVAEWCACVEAMAGREGV